MPDTPRIPSSDGAELEFHLSRSQQTGTSVGVVFLHGFPSGSVTAAHIGKDLPELADRVALEMGWSALTIRFRGCGHSTGDFSLAGWVEDAKHAVAHLRAEAAPDRVWIVGFGTGGAVGLVAAADDPSIVGAAIVGSPADFDDWARAPERLLAHAHNVGAITTPSFPHDLDDWKSQLRTVGATSAAERFSPRPLLVLHGSDDNVVPQFDARIVADAHGDAELRIIAGAGHQLRHDPRGIAVLLGWLERTRNELPMGASTPS